MHIICVHIISQVKSETQESVFTLGLGLPWDWPHRRFADAAMDERDVVAKSCTSARLGKAFGIGQALRRFLRQQARCPVCGVQKKEKPKAPWSVHSAPSF
jgi:hypothetical protein